jgi:hypothetical protein
MEMRFILARLVWEFDWQLLVKGVDWERNAEVKLLWRKPELEVRFKVAVRW